MQMNAVHSDERHSKTITTQEKNTMKQQKMVAVNLECWYDEKKTKLETILGTSFDGEDDIVMLQELPVQQYLNKGWTVVSYRVAGNAGDVLIVLLEKDNA